MARSLFVIGSGKMCGKSLFSLGLVKMAVEAGRQVAVLRPVINDPAGGGADHDISLLLKGFGLDQPYEQATVWTLSKAKELLLTDQALFFDTIIERHQQLLAKYDFVLCEGTDLGAGEEALEHAINFRVAAALGSQVVFVISKDGRSGESLAESVELACHALLERGVVPLAVAVNRVDEGTAEEIKKRLASWEFEAPKPLIVALPEDEELALPSMSDLREHYGADVLYGADKLGARVREYLIGAMEAEEFLERLTPGACVITPGDRTDIILATVAAAMSPAYPCPAGMVLTGGMTPRTSIHKLFEDWKDFPLPILTVETATYPTAKKLQEFRNRIDPADAASLGAALRVFADNVDVPALGQAITDAPGQRLTPEIFEYQLFEKARAAGRRIVLPEGSEERILRAAAEVIRQGVAKLILLGDVAALTAHAKALGLELSAVQIEDPATSPKNEDYAQTLFALRQHKGMTIEHARELMRDRTYYGTMMVYKGEADGMVSGSTTSTAETIRPALEFVKTKPGISIVSGVFFMCLSDRVLVYGDCAVNPKPTSEQLAQIAVSSAATARAFGIEPRVAMLSYSTGASGKGADVDLVREATRLAKELAPDLALDGPLQYDAAADPVVAAEKLPGSPVAGRATVFIFPDLDTGNNTYKAVQRSSHGVAMGPVLQGMNKPVNDLSRGCTVKDIVYTAAITAIQSMQGD
jgi:phosphate acetyltransferase